MTVLPQFSGVCVESVLLALHSASVVTVLDWDQLLRGERALNHPEAPAEAPSSQEKQPEFSV